MFIWSKDILHAELYLLVADSVPDLKPYISVFLSSRPFGSFLLGAESSGTCLRRLTEGRTCLTWKDEILHA